MFEKNELNVNSPLQDFSNIHIVFYNFIFVYFSRLNLIKTVEHKVFFVRCQREL